MKGPLCILVIAGHSAVAWAQVAELEFDGIFGECRRVYAATGDELHLYREPNLESERISIPYQAGWRIPAPEIDGMTRVLRIGSLQVIAHEENMYCEVEPDEGPATLVGGELVQYLHYIGEGFGRIRFRGGQCVAEVDESLGHFQLIEEPEVQVWLQVFYADGTSPGWLFHDGSQTVVSGMLC